MIVQQIKTFIFVNENIERSFSMFSILLFWDPRAEYLWFVFDRVSSMWVNNIESPTRCNNNDLLISKIISTSFEQLFAHLQERKTETIPRAVNLSLMLLKMGKSCPKHVELILKINKYSLSHLVGISILFTWIFLLQLRRLPQLL